MMVFSVVIPTYNRKDKLIKCLDALNMQTLSKSKFEVLVVDDASNDGTYEVLKKHDVKVFRLKKNSGRSVARNFGVSQAKGKYVVFTDSDCIVPNDWLQKIYSVYEKYDDAAGVGGGVIGKGTSIYARYETFLFSKYVKANKVYVSSKRDEAPFALGNMSYDRSAFLDLGGFNETIPDFVSHEDADLKERFLKAKRKIYFCPTFVEHAHQFGFVSFYNQSLQRGAGMLLDSKRKARMQTKGRIMLKILLTPFFALSVFAKHKANFKIVLCETLFYLFRNIGKLRYYDEVRSISI